MNSVLENYRKQHGLTYRALTELCRGISLYSIYRHCQGNKITAEAAVLYSNAFGIPLSELRPDLWPPEEGAKVTGKDG